MERNYDFSTICTYCKLCANFHMCAASFGNLKEPCQYRNAIDHLLESWKRIIDVSVKDENGKTALHLAIERHCDCETHAEIVKKILDLSMISILQIQENIWHSIYPLEYTVGGKSS